MKLSSLTNAAVFCKWKQVNRVITNWWLTKGGRQWSTPRRPQASELIWHDNKHFWAAFLPLYPLEFLTWVTPWGNLNPFVNGLKILTLSTPFSKEKSKNMNLCGNPNAYFCFKLFSKLKFKTICLFNLNMQKKFWGKREEGQLTKCQKKPSKFKIKNDRIASNLSQSSFWE